MYIVNLNKTSNDEKKRNKTPFVRGNGGSFAISYSPSSLLLFADAQDEEAPAQIRRQSFTTSF